MLGLTSKPGHFYSKNRFGIIKCKLKLARRVVLPPAKPTKGLRPLDPQGFVKPTPGLKS